MLTHGGRPHSASAGCHGTKLDYFKGAAVDVGRCQGLVPYFCSPNSLCASPGSNRCRCRRVAARSAPKWPCCLRPAVAEPGTRPGTLKPGHPFPPPKPGFEGVLGGSVSNFCFAGRISNARSFSTRPPPPPRRCHVAAVGFVTPKQPLWAGCWGCAARARGSSDPRALRRSRAEFAAFARSAHLRSGGSRGSTQRPFRWPPAGGQCRRAQPAPLARVPALRVLCTEAPPCYFNAGDFFLSRC